jgi:AraC-like DNA-binding protein
MELINEFIELSFLKNSEVSETIGFARYDADYIIVHYTLSNTDCLFDFSKTSNEIIIKIHKNYFEKYHQYFELTTEKQNVCCNTQSKLYELVNCNVTGIARNMFMESIVLYLVYQVQKNNLIFQLNCDTCSFVNKPSEVYKINRAKEFIVNNLDENITIPVLANLVGTNQCYLKKGFKELTGKTVFEFIQENRLEKARHLLQNSENTIADIANLTGYASVSSFSQSFKNYFGITPSSIAK